jgi:RNA polymerase sigma-70 factor (sigma-E family)
MSDGEGTGMARGGEVPAFDDFVVARSPHLLRIAYLLTHEWQAAEDLLQTTLARAWSAWSRIDGEPEPYVRRVLVNAYVSSRRRRWQTELPHAEVPEPAVGGHADDVAERDLVWQALGRLPRRQRAVVVLRYFEDLTEAQIGDVLGISAGTVKSQAAKAIKHLRVDPTLTPHSATERS